MIATAGDVPLGAFWHVPPGGCICKPASGSFGAAVDVEEPPWRTPLLRGRAGEKLPWEARRTPWIHNPCSRCTMVARGPARSAATLHTGVNASARRWSDPTCAGYNALRHNQETRIMRRRLAWLWFVAGSSVACVPDWARPIRDAGADAGESEGDDDSGEGLDADAGDAAQPPLDATGTVGGEPGEPAADTGLNDAVAEAGDDDGCAEGFVVRDGSCRDIDECSEGTHRCNVTATCANTDGGYDCKCASVSCEACKADADCQRFGMMCDEAAGTCVACTIDSEAVQCGGKSCNPVTHDCTQTDRASIDVCGRCVADSECKSDHRCIPMNFRGASRGGYCMKPLSSGCSQPFGVPIKRASLSGAASENYCGINEGSTSCEAVLALLLDRVCADGQASQCGAEGAVCGNVNGLTPPRCSYACEGLIVCPETIPCPLSGTDRYCGKR